MLEKQENIFVSQRDYVHIRAARTPTYLPKRDRVDLPSTSDRAGLIPHFDKAALLSVHRVVSKNRLHLLHPTAVGETFDDRRRCRCPRRAIDLVAEAVAVTRTWKTPAPCLLHDTDCKMFPIPRCQKNGKCVACAKEGQ